MSFWDSPLWQGLEQGKAPEVPISFEDKSIVYLSGALLLVAIIIILITYLFFKK